MKKGFTLLVFCFFISFCHSQLLIEWEENYGGTVIEWGRSVVATPDGGYLMAGHASSSDVDLNDNNGSIDYWIVKTDDSGVMQWQKNLGGVYNDQCFRVINTSDGGYALAGTSESNDQDVTNNHGVSDYWIVKLDSDGDIEWQRCYGGTSYDSGYGIIQTADGGYALCGNAGSSDGDVTGLLAAPDYWIVKIEADGDIEWQKTFGGASGDMAYSIVQADDGGYVMAGESMSWDSGVVTGNHGSSDFWVIKIDNDGDLLWQKSLGGTGQDKGQRVVKADGGYVVCGSTGSEDGDVTGFNGAYDFWVVKLDEDGNLVWQNSLGGYDDDKAFGLATTFDGGFLVTGFAKDDTGDLTYLHGGKDTWLIKLDAGGELLWQTVFGGVGDEEGYDVMEINPYEYILFGYTGSLDGDVEEMNGQADFWLLKLATDGNVPGDAIEGVNVSFSPNPFTNTTRVTISNGNASGGDLILVDAVGKVVYTSKITTNSFELERGELADGVYFYSVVSADHINLATGKVVVK